MSVVITEFENKFAEVVQHPAEADGFFQELWPAIVNLPKQDTKNLLDRVQEWAGEQTAVRPRLLGFALFSHGINYLLWEKYDEAIKHHLRAKEVFEQLEDADGIAICHVTMGSAYRTLGEVELALQYLLGAIPQLEKTDSFHFNLSIGSYHAGGIYAAASQFDTAMSYYEKTYRYAPVDYLRAHALSGMGEVCMFQKRYPEAKEYYDRAMRENGAENAMHTRILTDLANWYLQTDDLEEALNYNRRALDMRTRMNFSGAAITNMLNIADIYRRKNKPVETTGMLERALALAESIKVKPKIMDIHKTLSDIYKAVGDVNKAFRHFEKFHEISQEVSREDVKKRIKNMELILEAEHTRKENVTIRAQKAEIDKQHEELKQEKKKSDDLLLNILPAEVADELKETGTAEARHFDNVTVLFTDFVGFTKVAEHMTPHDLVAELHICFKNFDEIISRHGIEKIKTIGDAYLAVAGLPLADDLHAVKMVAAAIEIVHFMQHRKHQLGDRTFAVRIGIHSGPLVAGIVGVKKFAYDIWGDTVNTAARMEQSSAQFHINISQTTFDLVKDKFHCTYRGEIAAKNKGHLSMYFVDVGVKEG